MNSHIDVTGRNNSRSIVSANYNVDGLHHIHLNTRYYDQQPMSTMNSLGFNATSDVQHTYPYSSAINSQYVVPPQDMSVNKRIGYGDANYSANYYQFSYDA